jgi:uncharacterized protein YndB with AHSA1/START domain
MPARSRDDESTADREIVTTRVFDAPRELVWRAFTEAQHLVHWWGPKGFTNTFHEIEVRPGGLSRFVMHGPDGTQYPNRIHFHEVVRPERLSYTHGSDERPDQFRVSVTFVEQGDKTELTMRAVFPSAAACNEVKKFGAVEGGQQTLGKLAQHLPMVGAGAEEFSISRVFDAPRELVWKAYTEADRLAQWWGPKGFTMLVSKLDLRPGGVFHYGMQAPEGSAMGSKMWGKFVYREIVAPERLVFVNSFSDEAGGLTRHPLASNWPLEVLNVLTLAEHRGKTTLSMTGIPINASGAEREMFKGSHGSMQQGFAGTLDQLEQYLQAAPTTSASTKPELRMTRVFDAPKQLVFEAWSKAEHVARWFTPAPLTTPSCEVDLRPGGVFRLVMRMPNGIEHPMDARFLEVVPGERIVFLAKIHGDLEAHTTVTFVEHDGKTTLSVHQVYSYEADATRGAHAGWTQTLTQLAAHLRERA